MESFQTETLFLCALEQSGYDFGIWNQLKSWLLSYLCDLSNTHLYKSVTL